MMSEGKAGIIFRKKEHSSDRIPKIQSVHAILILASNYILQLRDNNPTISASGQWSLFGGMKRNNETSCQAINREIFEELSIRPVKFYYLWFTDYYSHFEKTIIRTWFYYSDVSEVWSQHKLKEGQAVEIFRYEQIGTLDMPIVMMKAIKRFHTQRKI